MGWTVHYQLLREQPLTSEERAALTGLATTSNEEPWAAEAFRIEICRAARRS